MSKAKTIFDKRLIFCVTPGRSGTNYLAKLLEKVPNVGAYHEPHPNFAQAVRLLQAKPSIAHSYLLQFKFPAIMQDPNPVYVETSHMACKGFLEPMIRMGLRPDLIFLRRAPREVAWSFTQRHCIPGRDIYGNRDLVHPTDIGGFPLPNWESYSDYQLCFWYALEMERRQLLYMDMAQTLNLTTVEIMHWQLNDWNLYAQMLLRLDLQITDEVRASHAVISGSKHNANSSYRDMPAGIEAEEEAVWDVVSHYMPHLRDIVIKRYGAPVDGALVAHGHFVTPLPPPDIELYVDEREVALRTIIGVIEDAKRGQLDEALYQETLKIIAESGQTDLLETLTKAWALGKGLAV